MNGAVVVAGSGVISLVVSHAQPRGATWIQRSCLQPAAVAELASTATAPLRITPTFAASKRGSLRRIVVVTNRTCVVGTGFGAKGAGATAAGNVAWMTMRISSLFVISWRAPQPKTSNASNRAVIRLTLQGK